MTLSLGPLTYHVFHLRTSPPPFLFRFRDNTLWQDWGVYGIFHLKSIFLHASSHRHNTSLPQDLLRGAVPHLKTIPPSFSLRHQGSTPLPQDLLRGAVPRLKTSFLPVSFRR